MRPMRYRACQILSRAYAELGIALGQLARIQEAECSFRQATQFGTTNVRARLELGLLDRSQEAMWAFQEAIALYNQPRGDL